MKLHRLHLFLLSLLLPVCALGQGTDTLTMIVGTYTEGSESKGIYTLRFNQSTGEAQLLSTCKVGNPSFVCVAPGNRRVYAVSEYNDGRQAAVALSLDSASGSLRVLNSQPTCGDGKGGEDPCNIWTDGHYVVTANYTGGSISVFPIAADGSLKPASQYIKYTALHEGGAAHIHCVRPTPDGRYLLATDLGNDRIYRFPVNHKATPQNGQPFLLDDTVVYEGHQGWGPRHFVFDKTGYMVYLINELGDYVCTFGYGNKRLVTLQYQLAYDGQGHGSADIHLSPDGRYLYTSHRLRGDGISIFEVDGARGMLHRIAYQSTEKHPRNFNITPNGRYLLCACRDGNCIQVFERDIRTGLLTDTGRTIHLPKPVCIQWVP